MTTPMVRTPRQAMSGPVGSGKTYNLADVESTSKPLPNRYAFHAGVGFGKTSFAAHAPSPLFVMTRGETGLTTLIDAGQLPPVPHLPEVETWAELTSIIKMLRVKEHPYKTLVIDTLNGAERMLHEFVCERDFGGDWTDRGFASYQKGYDVSVADWTLFLASLDQLRKERGMTIFCLVHTKIKTFRNPSGADYDRYTPQMHEKTWTVTMGWLDCILFGNFEVLVKTAKKTDDVMKKGKAVEASHRILYTNSDNPTFDAKNRFGLPDEIEMGDTPAEGWKNFSNAMKASRKGPQSAKAEPVAATEVA